MNRYLPKLPALLLILGAVLRLAGTGAAAIWFDESNMVYRAGIPILKLWADPSDNSVDLLLEIILRPLMAISHSVWLLRLPSMVAGLISLWLIWKLMQRLNFNPRQQIITVAIAAFLPGLLWIAQDARAYGLLSCLFLAAIWFALESQWLGLLAICGLTVYAHTTGPIYAVAALFIAAYLYPWKIRRILLVGLGVALAWIPAVVHIFSHWIIRQPWQPHLVFPWLVHSTIWAFWPEFYGGWFFLVALVILNLSGLFLLSVVKAHGRIIPLLAWLLPVTELIAFSLITQNNMVLYRTLMPMLFPFALWLGWELGRKRIASIAMLCIWTGMLAAGLMLWHPADRGGHLDQVADQIRSQWRTGDTLVYTTGTVGMPFDYYLGDLPHTWDDTVQHPFLADPGNPHVSIVSPTGTSIRSWVIIPKDRLITPLEQSALDDLIHHQAPVFTIKYVQAAQINVYLVEDK
jgi:hypothetical protein